MEGSVRYYYNDKEYVDYNKIKENSNKFKQDDCDLLIKRSCSCCERKILNKLNRIKETNNVKMFVKKPPCQICKWAIDDMLINSTVYYKLTDMIDDRIIKLVENI